MVVFGFRMFGKKSVGDNRSWKAQWPKKEILKAWSALAAMEVFEM